MVQLIIFGAVAWFAISMMKDLIRASEQKQKDIAAKDANEARVAARAAVDAAREEARAKAQADKAAKRAAAAAAMAAGVLAEDMVTCAICGVHTAIQESITTQGKFYCSEPHFLQRNQQAAPAEMPSEEMPEPMPEATVENI